MAITKTAELYLTKNAAGLPKFLRGTSTGLGKDLTNPVSLGFGALSVASGTGTVGGEVAGQVTGYLGANVASNLTNKLTSKIKLPGKLGLVAKGLQTGLSFLGRTSGGIAGYTAGDALGTKVAPIWQRQQIPTMPIPPENVQNYF